MPNLQSEDLKKMRRDLGLKHGISPAKVGEIIDFTLKFFKSKIMDKTDRTPIWIRNLGYMKILDLYDNPEKEANIELARANQQERLRKRKERSKYLKELRDAEANKNNGEWRPYPSGAGKNVLVHD